MWHSLFANFAVVALFVFAWLQSQDLLLRTKRPYRRAIFGVAMGAGAIVSMMLSSELQPGVFFDLRSCFVAIAAFMGGPIALAITAVAAGGFRLALGGVGAGGALLSIGLVAATGLGAHLWLGARRPGVRVIIAFSLATSVAPLVGFLFLPEPVRTTALVAAPPMILLAFIATFATALSIARSRRLTEERKLLLAAFGQAPDHLYIKDRDGRFVAVNDEVARVHGAASPADLHGKTDFDIDTPERAQALHAAEQRIIASGEPLLNIEELVSVGGAPPRWFLTSKVAVRNIDGEVMGIAGTTRDITDRKALERALVEGRDQFDLVLTEMSDGLARFDAGGVLKFCNEQYRALFPLTGRLRVPGAHLSDILMAAAELGEQLHIPVDGRPEWVALVMDSLRVGGEEEVPLLDGRWLHIRTRPMRDGGASVMVSDITNLKRAEAGLVALTDQLRAMVTTDALTGLVNRRGFDERLADEVFRAQRNRRPLSLIMVDIDRFKAFNDRYGHQAGDDCLKQVAAALRTGARRPADVVARYGGEEMTLVLPETDHQGAWELAEQLRVAVRALGIPHAGSEKGIVTVSIGVATLGLGSSDDSGAELLHQADEALYIAKNAGRDRVMGWGERHAARA